MNWRVLRFVGGAFAAVTLASAVLYFGTGQDDVGTRQDDGMTPQEAKQHVVSFVEDTIAYAAPGRTGTLQRPNGLRGSCYDRFGAMTDRTHRSYRWLVEEVDGTTGEEVIARTVELWRQRGLETRRDEVIAGVTAIDGSAKDDDFAYSLTVNRNERAVWFGASTPCLDGDPHWSDDL